MFTQTVRVREDDTKLWAMATALAGEEDLAGILAVALRAYIDRRKSEVTRSLRRSMRPAVGTVGTRGRLRRRVSLASCWLIDVLISNDLTTGQPAGWRVAVTAQGAYVVYEWRNEPSACFTYCYNLDELERAVPTDVFCAVMAELEGGLVERANG